MGHIENWHSSGYYEITHEVCKLSLQGLKIQHHGVSWSIS
jgi:hypothetical protein